MTHLVIKGIFIGLVAASGLVHADDYNLKPGLWEITSAVEIIEVDAPPEIAEMIRTMSQVPDRTQTQCIQDIESSIFADTEEGCETNLERHSASKITIGTMCTTADGTMNTNGEVLFNDETLTSTLNMTTQGDGVTMVMNVVSNGKYIGSCE